MGGKKKRVDRFRKETERLVAEIRSHTEVVCSSVEPENINAVLRSAAELRSATLRYADAQFEIVNNSFPFGPLYEDDPFGFDDEVDGELGSMFTIYQRADFVVKRGAEASVEDLAESALSDARAASLGWVEAHPEEVEPRALLVAAMIWSAEEAADRLEETGGQSDPSAAFGIDRSFHKSETDLFFYE